MLPRNPRSTPLRNGYTAELDLHRDALATLQAKLKALGFWGFTCFQYFDIKGFFNGGQKGCTRMKTIAGEFLLGDRNWEYES